MNRAGGWSDDKKMGLWQSRLFYVWFVHSHVYSHYMNRAEGHFARCINGPLSQGQQNWSLVELGPFRRDSFVLRSVKLKSVRL